MLTYHDHGINWMWYLDATIEDGKMTILRHYRIHKGDGNHPVTTQSFRLLEDGNRVVHSATIGGKVTYPVTNPKYIFDYKDH